MTAGLTALSGGAAVGGAAGAADRGLMSAIAAGLAGAAIGGAVGSISRQGVGVAKKMQDGLSWKQVGQAALGGVVTAGVGQALSGTGYLQQVGGMQGAQ